MLVRFLLVFDLLIILFRIALWAVVAICWERAVPLAFHLCCFSFLVPSQLYVSFSNLVFWAGCGIVLYRFLIVAFLSTLPVENGESTACVGVSRLLEIVFLTTLFTYPRYVNQVQRLSLY